jgi:hypothetical protein
MTRVKKIEKIVCANFLFVLNVKKYNKLHYKLHHKVCAHNFRCDGKVQNAMHACAMVVHKKCTNNGYT